MPDNEYLCPVCGSRDTRPSHPKSIRDSIWGAFGKTPRRCRACTKRFFVSVKLKNKKAQGKPKTGRIPKPDPTLEKPAPEEKA
jgi:hypothetical protein